MTTMVLRVAAKALVANDAGQVLILREAETNPDGVNPGKYHLPGGRLDVGETVMDTLHREVLEETGLEVEPLYPLHVDEWRPVIHGTPEHIVGIFFLCKPKTVAVRLSEEHDFFLWIDPAKHNEHDLLPGERNAIIAYNQRAKRTDEGNQLLGQSVN